MRFRWLAAIAVSILAGQAAAGDATALKNDREKVSYSIGMDIANNLKRQMIDVDPDILARGIRDAYSGKETLLTVDQAQEAIAGFQKELMEKAQERLQKAAEKNRMEGEAFLAENGKKEGVVTLPSGLQYKVIRVGDGPSPSEADTVETNYRGTLIDGTEFDSSYKRGQTAVFPVGGVIPGWTEALKLMKVGGKWQLFIPPELAYGERGAGPIGPNSTLIFDVELVSIESDDEQAPAKGGKPPGHP